MRITSTGSQVLCFIKKDLKKKKEGVYVCACVHVCALADGGGGRREGGIEEEAAGLTVTEILADMKAKGSGSLKNMKDKDEEQDGSRVERGKMGEK